jgi:hypothetical protein
MNLLLTLAAFAAAPAAPVPTTPTAGQPIEIAKSFELGSLAESFTLVSAEYKFDANRGGLLHVKLEARKEVEPELLRTCCAGFFDDDNTLQFVSPMRATAFPLQKGERLSCTIQTGSEDLKYNRIVVRKMDVMPASPFSSGPTGRGTRTAPGGGGFGGGGGFPGGGPGTGRSVPPMDPNDR